VVNSVIDQGPLIFVSIAQASNGQVDAIFSLSENQVTAESLNQFISNGLFMNYT
jgi:hypothetical protein